MHSEFQERKGGTLKKGVVMDNIVDEMKSWVWHKHVKGIIRICLSS